MRRLMVDAPRDDVPEPTVGAVVTCGYHLKLSPIMQSSCGSISPYNYGYNNTVFLLKIQHENNNIALASPNF